VSAFVRRAGLIWVSACGATAASVLLASCARDPVVSGANTISEGNWRIERSTDRITGAPVSSAFLVTRTVSQANILFPPPVQMQLGCFKEQPTVFFRFPFKVGSNRNGELSYRFDDRPGEVARARFVDDYTSVVIDDTDEVARFIRDLRTSNVLYVRTRAFNAPRSSAEFHVDGAAMAIESALAGCPVKQPARPAAG
jgi:hypothetical protein